ncbi:hypothetical protein F0P96_05435 [Hymenobacter busanensis]|uniref:Uncharacterized protein n=1 Tax=Hymenobacter busanensis TaxID=2607656 RepID=A0A7L5A2N6_9BACT|nr:hypothetical protein [Hymenobacter busanensis]KAA9338281.1 hypothetical protein F0P96_05435 [Hymenobacter busanensis]QHJ09295.1 hypothetical protein GUY19_19175 [Hymenobacter busanensis]
MTHKTKWLTFAPSGLMVIGFGTCLVQWATAMKQNGAPTGQWVAAGTVALGVFNAGMCLFGRGVAESVLYQLREKSTGKPHRAADRRLTMPLD